MELNFDGDKPIYLQIADAIRDAVFTGAFEEESQIPSTTELSAALRINPATVLKGMNVLVDENIIYKKRGLGMFVCEGALERIRDKRAAQFFADYIEGLVDEAVKLGLTKEDVIRQIERGFAQ